MIIKSKRRFTIFIATTMIVSGIGGFCVGVTYAKNSEVVNEEPRVVEKIEQIEEVEEEPEQITSPTTIAFEDLGAYTITAYCGCEICCGEWSSDPVIGSGNVELVEGVHCASSLPLGTIIEVEGLGTYEVQDRPSKWILEKYGDKVIDIYFENHEDAENFKMTAKVKKMIEVS